MTVPYTAFVDAAELRHDSTLIAEASTAFNTALDAIRRVAGAVRNEAIRKELASFVDALDDASHDYFDGSVGVVIRECEDAGFEPPAMDRRVAA
jgi:hypothetical protein